jgi:hypothetical protein
MFHTLRSAATSITLFCFELFIPHSAESMSEKKRKKNTGKKIAEKLEEFREVDKNERSKSEIAQAYGIPLSTLSTYLKDLDSVEQQASQEHDISKRMRIRDAKHGNMEEELFEWFCHARKNRLAVGGQTVKGKADEIALKCSNGWLQHFKERHNITWHSLSGEGASADLDLTEKWRENVKLVITQYASKDIFNRDETHFFIMHNQRELQH